MTTDQTARIAELLREAVTVLDEPFHRESVAATLREAADLLTAQQAEVETLRRERDEAVRMLTVANADYLEQRLARWATEAQFHLMQVRAEAAEARCTALEAALKEIAKRDHVRNTTDCPPLVVAMELWNECTAIAKAALHPPPAETR